MHRQQSVSTLYPSPQPVITASSCIDMHSRISSFIFFHSVTAPGSEKPVCRSWIQNRSLNFASTLAILSDAGVAATERREAKPVEAHTKSSHFSSSI